jgi:hypothetical protein
MMANPSDYAPPEPLPGLEVQGTGNVSPLVRALRRTVAAMDSLELLDELHALDLEACRLLARSAEMKLATGKASTISNDVDLLMRIKQQIVTPPTSPEGSVDSQLREAMADFVAQLDGAEA